MYHYFNTFKHLNFTKCPQTLVLLFIFPRKKKKSSKWLPAPGGRVVLFAADRWRAGACVGVNCFSFFFLAKMSFFLHLDETCVCADIMGVNFVVFSTLPYRELGDFICVCCYDYHYFCLQLSFFIAIIYIDLDFIMIHSNNECIYSFCFTIYLRTYICMYACKSICTTFVLHLLARNYLHFSLSELLPRCFGIFTIIGYFLFPFL